MSLDRKKNSRKPDQHGKQKPHSLDEPYGEHEQDKNFLCLSPENLNRSCQQLSKNSNHHHHHKRNELVTRTSTESKDTDSSSGSNKKHTHRSRSPIRNKNTPTR
ncbi:hypothetical protein AVEN_14302-1 [Araneus ventricosus]|uniref:Uncharacterized protein n=1 Tax=Araneus ventricosus TaxID=182803 RepID=A0A4Y2JY72_ARAVE|nr:hypothetical protein AVEN_14302-1 [Araneus ventricosus]